MKGISKEEAIEFVVSRQVTYLFKEFLHIAEEIANERVIEKDKLKKHLPVQYHEAVNLVDSLTPEKQVMIRKRILDFGNETKRNLIAELKEINSNVK